MISSGAVSVQSRQWRRHLGCPLDGPEHRACVQLGRRIQLELECRHDSEAAAAAPDGPEEIGLVLVVQPHEPALGGDELDRGHAVGREPSAPRQPAHAAAQRVADHTNIGRGTMENDEPLLGSGLDDILPERSSLDPRAMGARVDLDAAQARRLHEDRVIQHRER